ncbi:DUF6941 family protein [Pseudomonas aeruginosa]|uniref:DUF6941 family protein n=1 Tax=Pseudomonas aeruginosa TaxID=287 RepID=UPI000FD4B979|nr:hypothetical protein [Pseudomonas aeruginosa]MCT5746996.1 hypothetical protein [Pseudomonas aeruginosa]MCV2466838.1 hypothetical protein [Pseudomonas aeruginosa]MCV2472848.1 hypothetical protein [Pseudomonas aeruginosa]MCV2478854.1 hypothetical protein [Pseudomonas aeruginosa]RUE55767.1 hypothetical protein IPC1236_03695 [Pseudomonas aeruginosa]
MSRYVSTLFCDDIRNEIGGKVSYIGTYASTLYVKKFPATLPKLAIYLKATAPADDPFIKLSVQIMLDDKVIGEQDIDPDVDNSDIAENSKARLNLIRAHFVFSPFRVKETCLVKVKVTDEKGQEYLDSTLRIKENESNEDSAE